MGNIVKLWSGNMFQLAHFYQALSQSEHYSASRQTLVDMLQVNQHVRKLPPLKTYPVSSPNCESTEFCAIVVLASPLQPSICVAGVSSISFATVSCMKYDRICYHSETQNSSDNVTCAEF